VSFTNYLSKIVQKCWAKTILLNQTNIIVQNVGPKPFCWAKPT
jgi:hypothetical protein